MDRVVGLEQSGLTRQCLGTLTSEKGTVSFCGMKLDTKIKSCEHICPATGIGEKIGLNLVSVELTASLHEQTEFFFSIDVHKNGKGFVQVVFDSSSLQHPQTIVNHFAGCIGKLLHGD